MCNTFNIIRAGFTGALLYENCRGAGFARTGMAVIYRCNLPVYLNFSAGGYRASRTHGNLSGRASGVRSPLNARYQTCSP